MEVGGHCYGGWRQLPWRLEAIATRLEAIATRLEAIATRLEAIAVEVGGQRRATRLEAIAMEVGGHCYGGWRPSLLVSIAFT